MLLANIIKWQNVKANSHQFDDSPVSLQTARNSSVVGTFVALRADRPPSPDILLRLGVGVASGIGGEQAPDDTDSDSDTDPECIQQPRPGGRYGIDAFKAAGYGRQNPRMMSCPTR